MPVAMTDASGAKYFLHYDQVGSLRAVSDANGNVVKEIVYDAFGNILSDTNPSFTVPFGFAGGEERNANDNCLSFVAPHVRAVKQA